MIGSKCQAHDELRELNKVSCRWLLETTNNTLDSTIGQRQ